MTSVRMDAELLARVDRAAKKLSMSRSAFIRDAVSRRCLEVLGDSLAVQIKDFVGVIKGGGSNAKDAGKKSAKALHEKWLCTHGRKPD